MTPRALRYLHSFGAIFALLAAVALGLIALSPAGRALMPPVALVGAIVLLVGYVLYAKRRTTALLQAEERQSHEEADRAFAELSATPALTTGVSSVNVNTEPSPSSLLACSWPPMRRARRSEMAKPRPGPSPSAQRRPRPKIIASCDRDMPAPVSATAKQSRTEPSPCEANACTRTRTPPWPCRSISRGSTSAPSSV